MTHPYAENNNRLDSDVFDRLQRLISEHLGSSFPALGLAIFHQNELILDGAWGWVDPETQQHPTTPESRFDLASLTKLFVATAFLSSMSEGKVGVDDALVNVIPEFGEVNPRPIDGGQDPHSKVHLPTPEHLKGEVVDASEITFRHLLTHTSGLSPWRDVYRAAGAPPTAPDQPDPISRDERWANGLKAICNYPFVGKPGDKVRYSDLGLMLLGEATARLNGTAGRVDEAVQARVLSPLNLRTIIYNPVRNGLEQVQTIPTENDSVWRKRRCWGEVHDENACGVGGAAGHAGLFATAGEVAAFGQAWAVNDSRLGILPEIMAEATREQVVTDGERRGLGWMLKALENSSAGDWFAPTTYGHTGFTGTSLWIDPEHRLVVACLTNAVYGGRERMNSYAFRRALHTLMGEALV